MSGRKHRLPQIERQQYEKDYRNLRFVRARTITNLQCESGRFVQYRSQCSPSGSGLRRSGTLRRARARPSNGASLPAARSSGRLSAPSLLPAASRGLRTASGRRPSTVLLARIRASSLLQPPALPVARLN